MDSLVIIGFIIFIVLAVGMLLYIGKMTRKRSGLDREDFQRRWKRIEGLRAQGGAGWQLAIIEADSLLDQALKAAGHPGQTMGDRLKGARGVFRNNDDIWNAHKLRNRLAHEQDIHLNQIVVDQALGRFKSGLRDLGAL